VTSPSRAARTLREAVPWPPSSPKLNLQNDLRSMSAEVWRSWPLKSTRGLLARRTGRFPQLADSRSGVVRSTSENFARVSRPESGARRSADCVTPAVSSQRFRVRAVPASPFCACPDAAWRAKPAASTSASDSRSHRRRRRHVQPFVARNVSRPIEDRVRLSDRPRSPAASWECVTQVPQPSRQP
jgi:hypothetical protein